jgi:hypothetical protein
MADVGGSSPSAPTIVMSRNIPDDRTHFVEVVDAWYEDGVSCVGLSSFETEQLEMVNGGGLTRCCQDVFPETSCRLFELAMLVTSKSDAGS